ncbi:MAG: TrmO family methyltransferase domain-containing protein [Promethearchaeota archaeon]
MRGPTYGGEVKGVFASRSPRRPSSLGLATVKLLSRDGRRLVVTGLDAVDGTPVLDVKPHVPVLDGKEVERIQKEYNKTDPRAGVTRLVRKGDLEALLLRAGVLHGHFCTGLALGVVAGARLVKWLGSSPDGMENIFVIAETNNCASDGVQYVTGCTFGNNALVFRDFGKTAFTIARRDGKGLRVSLRGDAWDNVPSTPEQGELFDLVVRDRSGTDEDAARLKSLSRESAFKLVELPAEAFFDTREVEVEAPTYAPIHDTVVCEACGEPFMASRRVEDGGRSLCIACGRSPYFELSGSGIRQKSE